MLVIIAILILIVAHMRGDIVSLCPIGVSLVFHSVLARCMHVYAGVNDKPTIGETMTVRKQYVYTVYIPGDYKDSLDWFEVFPSMRAAKIAADHYASSQDDGLWGTVSFTAFDVANGRDHFGMNGQRCIVIEQTESYYHGA